MKHLKRSDLQSETVGRREILAIVGPSSGGKSSLLEFLAAKVAPQTGSVLVKQKTVDKAKFKKYLVMSLTKGTLVSFAYSGRNPHVQCQAAFKSLPDDQLRLRVKSLVHELGLEAVAMARVGDDRVREISGGERRHVSIGVEVIHDPNVLILDEATSGLGSFGSADHRHAQIKLMTETRGRTIILSIHQPGFHIVKLFNSVLLLTNGSVLNQGLWTSLVVT